MKGITKKLTCALLVFVMLLGAELMLPDKAEIVSAASNSCRIHFLTLNDNTDAILLECNGKFGMVDSGEDNDYPKGYNPNYPSRPGVVKGNGFEKDVISYLQSVGVTQDNFEFYIGTHPHSDHIGSADDIIYTFHPKRVYIEAYSDNDITDSTHLWDNLYVYDQMIKAAQDTGTTLIQTFNPNAPLYPETVTVKGSILWENTADIPPESEEKPDGSDIPDSNSSADNDLSDSSQSQNGSDSDKEMTDTQNPGNSSESSSDAADDLDSSKAKLPIQDISAEAHTENRVSEDISDIPKKETSDNIGGPEDNNSMEDLTDNIDNAAEDDNKEEEITPPSDITITLSYETTDSETVVPADVTVHAVSAGNGIWTYEFTNIRKYDDTKTPFTYSLAPAAVGYDFTSAEEGNTFDFICTPEQQSLEPSDAEIISSDNSAQAFKAYQEESGLTDEPLPIPEEEASDNLTAGDIPYTDQVDPEHPDDPNNAHENVYAAPAQSGIFDGETVGSVSTPVFMLGGKNGMKIEIMNYGVKRPQPDANYFSLGIKLTSASTGKTAFLAGDINNYIGAETALATRLGHVDVLKLGHHGYYGSNTYSYLKSLSPNIAIMTGKYNYVSNSSIDNNIGTLDSLLQLAKSGTPLYPTAWYAPYIKAITVNLDNSLSNNIPNGKEFIASAERVTPYRHIYYYNGFPTKTNGWKKASNGSWYYFENSYDASINKWLQNTSGQWFYLKNDGTMAVGWASIGGKWYYMNSSGVMTTGWQQVNGKWYYMDSNGVMLTGRHQIGKYFYYLDSSTGAMASDQYVNGYYYDSSGKWIPDFKDGNWKHNATGYWYQFGNGTYPKNCWLQIHGQWYYFNASGYMMTGWLKQDGKWYYLNGEGAMCIGWYKVNNVWYYSNASGEMLTGLQTLGGRKYYFTGSGAMATGWVKLENIWYYFTNNGANTGWFKVGNTWYYSNAAGQMQTGWIKSNGKFYYTSSSGAMMKGWLKLGKTWYYLNDSGAMLTGWYKVNNIWYYSDSSGAMLTGLHNLGGKKYYLTGSGAMATGWVKLGKTWYYFTGNGSAATGWYKVNNIWYYSNAAGEMLTGLHNLGGKKYYFTGSGAMATGWVHLSNKWYYFTGNGAAATGWYKVNNIWYYSNAVGEMQTGWLQSNGKKYYLYGNGAMATGWVHLGRTWYYFTNNGAVITGWYQVNNIWYYSNASGEMQTGWLQSGGKKYYLYGNGAMASGWLHLGNKWYYMTPSGAMTTGWQHVNGKWYYLNPSDGIMYANAWTPDGYYVNTNGAWTVQRRN